MRKPFLTLVHKAQILGVLDDFEQVTSLLRIRPGVSRAQLQP